MKIKLLITGFCLIVACRLLGESRPLKVGIIGLTHTHVHWIFESEKRGDIAIVGIVEPNRELAARYALQHGFSMSNVFNTSKELIKNKDFEVVTAFGNTYDHLRIVETFAPLGIHIMVEKPLAVNLDHAKKMEALAKKHGIFLLTNYETTWYPTNHQAYEIVKKDTIIGDIRKVVVRDGHKGPKQIGVNQEFLEWLTDPVLNGGGALMDFGCYGANLMTWLMDGKKPNSVTAVTQQLQNENNPKVDDEAVIILSYDNSIAVIQASWNWPIGRKDMEIYGLNGVIYSDNRHDLRVKIAKGYDGFAEESLKLGERNAPFDDPFSYFAALVRKEITISDYDLSSLENNMIVMEILDAAIKSAQQNRTIILDR